MNGWTTTPDSDLSSEMISIPRPQDEHVTLATGESVSLRFAVHCFYYLKQLSENAAADFAQLLSALGDNTPVPTGQLRGELIQRNLADSKGVLDTEFRKVFLASLWEVGPGHVELIVPIPSPLCEAVPQQELWNREVERYKAEVLARHSSGRSDEPGGLPSPP